jgi:hypothetical protein
LCSAKKTRQLRERGIFATTNPFPTRRSRRHSHNGMGKTTLLRTLMGFVSAQRGRITFDEVDITREPPYVRARRGLGYVPQGREIFPGLSCAIICGWASLAAAPRSASTRSWQPSPV